MVISIVTIGLAKYVFTVTIVWKWIWLLICFINIIINLAGVTLGKYVLNIWLPDVNIEWRLDVMTHNIFNSNHSNYDKICSEILY